MTLSVRARLALWYGGVFALFLAIFAAAVLVFVARSSLASLDDTLLDAARTVAAALDLESRAHRRTGEYVPEVIADFGFHDLAVAAFDRKSHRMIAGWTADSGDAIIVEPLQATAILASARGRRPLFSTVELPNRGGTVRVLALPHRLGSHQVVIGAMLSLKPQRRLVRRVGTALAFAIPLFLLFASAGGYLLARKSLRPVTSMAERAARIGSTNLHDRLPVQNPGDELGRLAVVFNELLERLDRAFDQQRQFIADASHELRTPVAILSGEAGLALSQPGRSREELESALRAVRAEAVRLQQIVEGMFLLARSDAGEPLVAPEELYLGELAAECVRSVRTLAQQKGVTVVYEGSGDLPFTGDAALLRRAIMNLLDNAIKYTPSGGRITVRGSQADGRYAIEVEDSGGGIPGPAQPKLFDRFFRVRGDASAQVPGAGLGLAIARRIAEAHLGALTLARSDERGSVFLLELPAPARMA